MESLHKLVPPKVELPNVALPGSTLKSFAAISGIAERQQAILRDAMMPLLDSPSAPQKQGSISRAHPRGRDHLRTRLHLLKPPRVRLVPTKSPVRAHRTSIRASRLHGAEAPDVDAALLAILTLPKKLAAAGEAAAAETLRANRRKFFESEIPVLPVISHRNARELLADLLKESAITGIDRRLVDLVSQHSSNMRLLRNIRDEYPVFAKRLLQSRETVPGLGPSEPFEYVAYKNFHLEDFANTSRRASNLDRL